MTIDERVVASARGWIGTRFHHQGRLKKTDKHKGGVDCLGLLIGVAKELQLQHLTSLDETSYPHYPDCERLKTQLAKALNPVSGIRAGGIVLLNIAGNPQHLGIISDGNNGYYGLIHAYAPARAVVEHVLDEWWKHRIEAIYRITH